MTIQTDTYIAPAKRKGPPTIERLSEGRINAADLNPDVARVRDAGAAA